MYFTRHRRYFNKVCAKLSAQLDIFSDKPEISDMKPRGNVVFVGSKNKIARWLISSLTVKVDINAIFDNMTVEN